MDRSRVIVPVLCAVIVLITAVILLSLRGPSATQHPETGIRVINGNFTTPSNERPQSKLPDGNTISRATAARSDEGQGPADGIPADLDPSERAAMIPRQFRGEPRDPAWAPAAEKTLQHAYAGIPYLASDAPMTVRCATSLCEISGGIDSAASLDNQNIAMQQLQDGRSTEGFAGGSATFGPIPGRPKGSGYRLYVRPR